MRVRIKICCICSILEAHTAVELAADAVGLNPGNVRQAVEEVQPYAVDVCSGVRTNGMLDKIKLSAFIKSSQETIIP